MDGDAAAKSSMTKSWHVGAAQAVFAARGGTAPCGPRLILSANDKTTEVHHV